MTWKTFTIKWLILLHRWMGIVFCLLFISFFVSGIVMMYARMPRLTKEERLMRLPELDFSSATLTPDDALKKLGVEGIPTSFRMTMFGNRPVYRMEVEQQWRTLFADNGEVLLQISDEQAVSIGKTFFPDDAAGIQFIESLVEPDQWTLSSSIRRLAPLRKIALNDAHSTQAYISAQTGEVVLKTDAAGRFWGYVGAVFHWIYFTPLRKHTSVWVWAVVVISFFGSLMCVLGIVVGIWRLSFRRRFQQKTGGSMSPYRGIKRLHHWLGLTFGWFTFTWILSGLFSMNPFDWSPGTSPTPFQVKAVAGNCDVSKIALTPFAAQQVFEKEFKVRELELVPFRGNFFYFGVEPPKDLAETNWSNTDQPGYLASETKLQQRFVDAVTGKSFEQFSVAAIEQSALAAMPDAKIAESVWLTEYDSYYYSQDHNRNLPVLRVKFDDEKATWLYLDPQQGQIVLKHETLSRIERWLYHGLHSLDFPIFYQSRPWWDIVMVFLSLGGIALSWTAVKLGWDRVRKWRM